MQETNTTNSNLYEANGANKGPKLTTAQYDYIRHKTKSKATKDFDRMFLCQTLLQSQTQSKNPSSLNSNQKSGALWTMKFSRDGEYLAVGGQDAIVRVWGLKCLQNQQQQQQADNASDKSKNSIVDEDEEFYEKWSIFTNEPVRTFYGHTADILDLSWSKSGFLLTSSMDKTVRLWHISRQECLCCFQHVDFVTSVAFHPKNDRYYLSGSLDSKIRLWNIPEKKVTSWAELPESNLVTAVAFTRDGKLAVAGSYQGLCVFYETEGLKYHTQIHVGKSKSSGRKITSIEALPGSSSGSGEGKLLIASNDSRIRLYNLRDKALERKYKGLDNTSSQIKATFSDDGRFIISGSESKQIFIWSTDNNSDPFPSTAKKAFMSFKKKDEETSYETLDAHSAIVTAAIVAPTTTKQILMKHGDIILNSVTQDPINDATVKDPIKNGHILISCDYAGNLKVFRRDIAHLIKQSKLANSSKSSSRHTGADDDNSSIARSLFRSKDVTRSINNLRTSQTSGNSSRRSSVHSSREESLNPKIVLNNQEVASSPLPPIPSPQLESLSCPNCNTGEHLIQFQAKSVGKSKLQRRRSNSVGTSTPSSGTQLPNEASGGADSPRNIRFLTICNQCSRVVDGL
jgi:WD40 repeat protein